ncbi:MAG: hypothetical protein JHC20_05735 [Pyrobaculum sp.]|nr:hypothetical protein [Pyrobaculum sp.]
MINKNKKLFGGKGASLIQMAQLGLRVSPGFIVTTEPASSTHMWTKLRNFITSMCLILAPYIDVRRFGAPKEKSDLKQEREPLH